MIKCSIIIIIIIIFNLTILLQLILYSSSLSNNHFGECITKICGNLNITYPFYIINQQKPYCGYPGFEVECRDHKSLYINISSVSYLIRNVSYEDQTLRVVNSMLLDFVNGSTPCVEALHQQQQLNFTLNSDMFTYTGTHKDEVYLFLNCSARIQRQNLPDWTVCGAVGVYKNESRLIDIEKLCEGSTVVVPYDSDRPNVGNLRQMLEEGFSLKRLSNDCSPCTVSGGQCGYNQSINEFSSFCSDGRHLESCPLPHKKTSVADNVGFEIGKWLVIVIILMIPTIVICLIIYITRRVTSFCKSTVPWSARARGNRNVEAFLKIYGSLASKRYTYSEIKVMTSSFKHKLGEGGYGAVYKGKLRNGRLVAVKKLKNLKGNGEDFINEVVSISRTNHVNVVALLGFCVQRNKRALVYEFMPNGSLENFICRTGNVQQLSHETLIEIAVGVAKGLDYLHRGCNARILHFDIKPHNILLDGEFCPKISDFGLAKLSETKNSVTSMLETRGTIGYIAPEVFCKNFGGVSHKSDVYSYGMMILDVACGRKNVVVQAQDSSEQYFPDWIYDQLELQETTIGANEISEQGENGLTLMRKMILVGLWCIQTYPSNRPSMSIVVEMLEGDVDSIELPPKPLLCSPSRSEVEISDTFTTAVNVM